MRAILTQRRTLTNLPSGSALERVGDYWFIVSDDTAVLYRLDSNGNPAPGTNLFTSDFPPGTRIPKPVKPDLEAMTLVEWQGRRELLCFGSGSKVGTRDRIFRVDVSDPALPQVIADIYAPGLYNALRADPRLVGTHTLNLEAAASDAGNVYLLQRGNISGKNALASFALADLMAYLERPEQPLLPARVREYQLPALAGRLAGFSGASFLDETRLLFCASVEDTPDEVQDGPTLGSFVGVLRLDAGENRAPELIAAVELNGTPAPVKIEGIAYLGATDKGFRVLGLTDDDEGDSEFLWIEVIT